jgi:hypothetical protein
MIRSLSVLEEGSQGGDRFSGPGGRVDEEDPSALDQVLDLVDRGFLARAGPVGEERTDYGGGVVGGRRITCRCARTSRRV